MNGANTSRKQPRKQRRRTHPFVLRVKHASGVQLSVDARRHIQELLKLARNTDWPEVAESITEEQLVAVLQRSSFIRKFLEAAEQYALSRMMNNHPIPGFKVVGTKKHRKWKDEDKAEDYLVQRLGGKAWTKKLITPAQAEKALKEDLKDLIVTPEGDPCLAPASDPRPELPWIELKVLDTSSAK